MKDSGLLLIMDKKGDSLLCASLYEYLDNEERKRAFYLIEEREIHKIIEEEQRKEISNSLSEIQTIKQEVKK